MTDLRPFLDDELVAAHEALALAFGSDPVEAEREIDTALFSAAQTLGAFDGPSVVGTAAYYDLPMSLPGGSAAVAGVTWVTVAPTHHRRGIVRSLMTRQLSDLHGSGRALAMLWASEPGIYNRFGYGLGSWQLSLELRRGAAFRRPVEVGAVTVVRNPTAALLAPLYDAVVASRPGWFARSPQWWTHRLFDPADHRGGATTLRAVVIDGQGYALFRTKSDWAAGGANGTVMVGEVVAATPEVEARLWRFLLDQDLMERTKASMVPVDSPLLHLLADVRRPETRISDGLWVRLVSVPDALVLRTYSAPVDVVLEVTDEVCPWNAGRWHLTGTACVRTEASPDLTLDVSELGAVFLGGTTLAARAAAGWVVEHTPGAVAAASLAFSWHGRAPHCPLVF